MNLKGVDNAGAFWKRTNLDISIKGGKMQWKDQWEDCLRSLQTTRMPECAEYPGLKLFPGLVQSLLVEQLKEAMKSIDEGKSYTID